MSCKSNYNQSSFKCLSFNSDKKNSNMTKLFEHRTGLQVLYNENIDDQNIFTICFRTPSFDNTGAAHVLEHMVLCGSKNYRQKKPLMELFKSSSCTYSNAMTFPDKTMFLGACSKAEDYILLMDVFLDAVFNPIFYSKPAIFLQERGCFYKDLNNDEIRFSGVVFNEMKKVYATPGNYLIRMAKQSLLRNTIYSFDPGGYPLDIMELSLDSIIDFHKTYYHPSNCFVYISGVENIDDKLNFIDSKHLQNFRKKKFFTENFLKNELTRNEIKMENKSINGKIRKVTMSFNFSISTSLDADTLLSFKIIKNLFDDRRISPFTKGILNNGKGQNIRTHLEEHLYYPCFSIIIDEVDENEKEILCNLVEESLISFIQNDIDSNLFEASKKKYLFFLDNLNPLPDGIRQSIDCTKSWIYNENPELYINKSLIKRRCEKISRKDLIKQNILKYLINNKNKSIITVMSEEHDMNIIDNAIKKKIQSLNCCNKIELDKIHTNMKILQEWHETSDPIDHRFNTIKKDNLLSELKQPAKEVKEILGVKTIFIYGKKDCKGYLTLLYDLSTIEKERVTYLRLLVELLFKLETAEYSNDQIGKLIKQFTNGFSLKVECYSDFIANIKPRLVIRTFIDVQDLTNLMKIITQVTKHTIFSNGDRIKEILKEACIREKYKITQRDKIYTKRRLHYHLSSTGYYEEITNGISSYHFIKDILDNYDLYKRNIANTLDALIGSIFNRNNMIISFTAEEKEKNIYYDKIAEYINSLGYSYEQKSIYSCNILEGKEALITGGKIQNITAGYNYFELGFKYSGKLMILQNITMMDYFWNEIRQKSGGYQSTISFQRSGILSFLSSRNPNLNDTLEVLSKCYIYFQEKKYTNDEINKFIFLTIKEMNKEIPAPLVSERIIYNYINNITNEDQLNERNEIMCTTANEIKQLSCIYKQFSKDHSLCIFGECPEKVMKEHNLMRIEIK